MGVSAFPATSACGGGGAFFTFSVALRRRSRGCRQRSGMAKELITVGLKSCNQLVYLRDALEGVVSQTYRPLQIVIAESASPCFVARLSFR